METRSEEIIVNTEPKPEHKVRIYKNDYHGVGIKIIEFDREDSWQAGIKYKIPEDWRELLTQQVNSTTGPIAPEYCMPDLESGAFNELGVGGIVRLTSEYLDITPLFGHISKLAGVKGRALLATDIASTIWYMPFEAASMHKVALEDSFRELVPNLTNRLGLRKYDYEYGKIEPGEYQLHTSNDARHLIAARGLMQEALTTDGQQILSVWAPKHAERIDDYIKRQIEFEIQHQTSVTRPIEFRKVSPQEESKKMTIYGRPPLHRTVREYVPILSPLAYEIDLMLNGPKQKIRLDQISDIIERYLKTDPENRDEKKIYGRIQRVQERINKLRKKKKLSDGDYRKLIGAISTDRFGWRLKRKSYIY